MSVVIDALRQIDWTNRHVLVACSGGLDSTVLLHGLIAIGLKPEILHVNYGLRGADSNADETFVRGLAKKFDLPVHVRSCPQELLKGEGINLQGAARDFRRKQFEDWNQRSENHCVVLAHHADDQLETFFLQLFRGGGTFGLGGMHTERSGLLRPLLNVSKADLKLFAQCEGIEWREDHSNASNTYLRNVWRNDLLPEMLQQSPSLRDSMLLIMECFRDRQLELQQEVEGLVSQWMDVRLIDVKDWMSIDHEARLAFTHYAQLPSWTLDRLTELCERPTTSCFDLGDGIVVRERDRLIYRFNRTKKQSWDFKIEDVGILPTVFDKNSIFLDPQKLEGEIHLRLWRGGDRIQSLGMNGSQLVSDVLKDAGIPFSDRSDIQVLTDGVKILWVPGVKVGRTALADASTEKVWKVELIATGG